MAFVRVEQRNAHLAGAVRLHTVEGRDGPVSKATVNEISNTRRGSGDNRGEEATAIQWTLWGKQAENAAEYLGKGSHVNIVGRLRNNNYQDSEGADVYALGFTAEEVDYLDGPAESEARHARERVDGGTPNGATGSSEQTAPSASGPKPRSGRQQGHAHG